MVWRCSLCGEEFETYEEFGKHFKEVHLTAISEAVSGPAPEAEYVGIAKAAGDLEPALVAPLKDVPSKMDDYSSGTAVTIGAVLLGSTLAASVPTVSIGDAVDEVWRFPGISSRVRITTDYLTSAWNNVVAPKLRRLQLSQYTPLLPEPYRLAMQVSKGILDWPTYEKAMHESGLSTEWALAWATEQEVYPSFRDIMALWRRGAIDHDRYSAWMHRSGYNTEVRETLEHLKDVIPPLDDLIRMAVREAFPVEPGPPQFEAIKPWAAKMGLSADWVDKYVLAHWVRMDLARAYANVYWSQIEGEPEFDIDKYLILADIHPDDRKWVKRVMWRTPSIREMGYGYDMGVWKKPDIVNFRMREGLKKEDAEKAAEALVAYRVSAETEAVRREWLYLYVMGKRTREEFEAKLHALNTSDEAIALWIDRGDLQRERKGKPLTPIEPRIITASEAKWMFLRGLRNESWYREKLASLDWDTERINVAVERAYEEMRPPEEAVEYRKLTVSQIQSLYRAGKITKVELPAFFEAIGYSPEHAAMLAQITVEVPVPPTAVKPYTDAWSRRLYAYRILDYEELYSNYLELGYDSRHAADLTMATILAEEYPMLVAKYRKGYINELDFVNALLDYGMKPEGALSLLDRTIDDFKLERLERERDLTKSEIIKGVKAAVIGPGEGVLLLQDLGYEEWEAQYILAINKIVGAGDPEGYWEMRRVTEAYKKAAGKAYQEIPDEVLMLEKAIAEKKKEIEGLKAREATEKEIGKAVAELGDLEARLRTVVIKAKLT